MHTNRSKHDRVILITLFRINLHQKHLVKSEKLFCPYISSHLDNLLMILFHQILLKLLNLRTTQIQSKVVKNIHAQTLYVWSKKSQKYHIPHLSTRLIYGGNKNETFILEILAKKSLMNNLCWLFMASISINQQSIVYTRTNVIFLRTLFHFLSAVVCQDSLIIIILSSNRSASNV